MDIQKEREAFENWWESFHNGRQISCDYVEKDNSYAVGYANAQWVAWQAKAQAVPEGRTDSEIIDQTIQLVDLLASANRFQRDKSKPFPFESKNPRNMEWWRLACQIQELITDTDPNNCDFEEYKAMIEAQEPAND